MKKRKKRKKKAFQRKINLLKVSFCNDPSVMDLMAANNKTGGPYR